MCKLTFNQEAMGGEKVKTTIGTNVYYLMGLDRVGTEDNEEGDGLMGSSGVWSPGFVNALVMAMKFWDKSPRCCPTVASLSAEQWKRHIQSNHADYQRDCLACVMGRGTGRRHARVRHPDMFNLTVDIAGPVKPGLDVSSKGTMGKGLRYMMVAKYTLPKEYVKGYTGRSPPDDHGQDLGQPEVPQPNQEIARPSLPLPHDGGECPRLLGQPEVPQPNEEIARPSLPLPHDGGECPRLLGQPEVPQPNEEIARPSLPLPHDGGDPFSFEDLDCAEEGSPSYENRQEQRGGPIHEGEDHSVVKVGGFVGSTKEQQEGRLDYEDSLYDPSEPGEGGYSPHEEGQNGDPRAVPRDRVAYVIQDCEAPEATYLLFARPLTSNTSAVVKAAIQDVILYLQTNGLPVYRLHSDKGEVYCHSIRSWLRDQGVRATFSEPGVPQGNGAAEGTVRWLKDKARTMLIGAKLPTRLWPTAVEAAAAIQRARVLGGKSKLLAPYGAPVCVKQKAFDSSGPRRRERAFETRWTKAVYVGLSNILDNGHVVFIPGSDTQHERFMHTFHVRAGLVDPGRPAAEVLLPEVHKPRRRLTEKTPLEQVELRGLSLSAGQLAEYIQDRSRVLLSSWSQEGAINLVDELAEHGFFDELKFGVFRHGGSVGWLKGFKEFPELTKVLARIILHDHPEATFTALMVAKTNEKGMHRDFNNDEGAVNYVMPIRMPKRGGDLWVELGPGDRIMGEVIDRQDDQGRTRYGQLYKLTPGTCNVFSPRRLHDVLPWEGQRTVLIAYTPQGLGKITDEMIKELEEYEFVPPLTQYPEYFLFNEDVQVNSLDANDTEENAPVDYKDVEDLQDSDADLEEWEMFLDAPTGRVKIGDQELDTIEDAPQGVQKLEVTYTKGVEAIIAGLKGPLEVTYTVDPREVHECLDKWAPAIRKEVEGVSVAIKRLLPHTDERTEWFRRPGAQKLPTKLVFTIKPGDDPQQDRPETWYKRKVRLVVCGNYASNSEGDLYSETAPAEAVRVGLTMSRRRKWQVGLIDIIQAFLRTPLDPTAGDPTFIVTPPKVLEKLLLTTVGEMWGLVRALYGLRQAPALWSSHRDRVLRQMVFPGQLQLRQGRTITAWWVLKNQAGVIIALIIIYVDDILLLGEEPTICAIAETIQKTWKTSPLAILTSECPSRFLGMELEIEPETSNLYLNQRGYIEEILRAHNVPEGVRDKIPVAKEQSSFELLEEDAPPTTEAITESQRITGEVMWIAQRTRPDLAYTCSLMASITLRAPYRCLAIGEKVLRYLQGTKDYRMKIVNDGTYLVLYPDSAFAPTSSKSQTGWTVYWSGTPIGWRSSRQSMISLSTAECELQAILDGAIGMMGLEALLYDLDVEPGPKTVASDSTSALAIGSGTGSWRTRHLRLKAAWLHDMVSRGEIVPRHQPGIVQPADLLTKALSGQRIVALLDLWGVDTRRRKSTSSPSSAIATKVLVATVCCIMMLGVEALEEESDRSIRLDWDMAGIFMVLLMVLGGLVLWEAVKWGALEFYREWTPGASKRKLNRLRKLRDATSQAIERELARIAEKEHQPGPSTRQPSRTMSTSSVLGSETTPMPPSMPATPPSMQPTETTPVRRRYTTPISSPATPHGQEREYQDHGEVRRVCHDILLLMTCEHLREGLRLEGCLVSGVKEDLATRLGGQLAIRVNQGSPTVRQLRYLLWLWRQRDLSGRALLQWQDLRDKASASSAISRWQRL